jgi:hypothetical protein
VQSSSLNDSYRPTDVFERFLNYINILEYSHKIGKKNDFSYIFSAHFTPPALLFGETCPLQLTQSRCAIYILYQQH